MKKIINHSTKYPKFTRQENKCCKLLDNEIKEIREYYKDNRKNYKSDKSIFLYLGDKYRVFYQTIRYWCKEEYRQMILVQSKKRVQAEWNSVDGRKKALERRKKLKKDWTDRKGSSFENYNHNAVKLYNSYVRKFIKQNKQEFVEFLKKENKKNV